MAGGGGGGNTTGADAATDAGPAAAEDTAAGDTAAGETAGAGLRMTTQSDRFQLARQAPHQRTLFSNVPVNM